MAQSPARPRPAVYRPSESTLEAELENMTTKMRILSHANEVLRRQIDESLHPNKVKVLHAKLELSERKLKDANVEIATLKNENKRLRLAGVQKVEGETKKKIITMQAEIQFFKDKAHKAHLVSLSAEKKMRAQQERLVGAEQRIRGLEEKLKGDKSHSAINQANEIQRLRDTIDTMKQERADDRRRSSKIIDRYNRRIGNLEKQLKGGNAGRKPSPVGLDPMKKTGRPPALKSKAGKSNKGLSNAERPPFRTAGNPKGKANQSRTGTKAKSGQLLEKIDAPTEKNTETPS